MILELKGIYKEYQQGKMKVPVLKDVNFSMEEGEYVAIMGPSGSGKTTLMNIIGCLDKHFRGGPADQRKSVPYPAATPRTGRKRPAAGFLFFIYICLRSRATGIPSISRYLATVRRAIR